MDATKIAKSIKTVTQTVRFTGAVAIMVLAVKSKGE